MLFFKNFTFPKEFSFEKECQMCPFPAISGKKFHSFIILF